MRTKKKIIELLTRRWEESIVTERMITAGKPFGRPASSTSLLPPITLWRFVSLVCARATKARRKPTCAGGWTTLSINTREACLRRPRPIQATAGKHVFVAWNPRSPNRCLTAENARSCRADGLANTRNTLPP